MEAHTCLIRGRRNSVLGRGDQHSSRLGSSLRGARVSLSYILGVLGSVPSNWFFQSSMPFFFPFPSLIRIEMLSPGSSRSRLDLSSLFQFVRVGSSRRPMGRMRKTAAGISRWVNKNLCKRDHAEHMAAFDHTWLGQVHAHL